MQLGPNPGQCNGAGGVQPPQAHLYMYWNLQGILMLEKDTHRVIVLTNRVSKSSPLDPDTPIIYANDLDVAKDGTVYFTTSIDIHLHRYNSMGALHA